MRIGPRPGHVSRMREIPCRCDSSPASPSLGPPLQLADRVQLLVEDLDQRVHGRRKLLSPFLAHGCPVDLHSSSRNPARTKQALDPALHPYRIASAKPKASTASLFDPRRLPTPTTTILSTCGANSS